MTLPLILRKIIVRHHKNKAKPNEISSYLAGLVILNTIKKWIDSSEFEDLSVYKSTGRKRSERTIQILEMFKSSQKSIRRQEKYPEC